MTQSLSFNTVLKTMHSMDRAAVFLAQGCRVLGNWDHTVRCPHFCCGRVCGRCLVVRSPPKESFPASGAEKRGWEVIL